MPAARPTFIDDRPLKQLRLLPHAPPSTTTSTPPAALRSLLLDYLVHECFVDTAQAFLHGWPREESTPGDDNWAKREQSVDPDGDADMDDDNDDDDGDEESREVYESNDFDIEEMSSSYATHMKIRRGPEPKVTVPSSFWAILLTRVLFWLQR
jgi:hypothetical protein